MGTSPSPPCIACLTTRLSPLVHPQLAEQAERYDEMVNFMKDVAKVRSWSTFLRSQRSRRALTSLDRSSTRSSPSRRGISFLLPTKTCVILLVSG
jgi:hypothetical protein